MQDSELISADCILCFERGLNMAKMATTKLPILPNEEIMNRLPKELPKWELDNEGWIKRIFKTDGWQTTLMVVNTVAFLAEAAWHHPDMYVTWAKVSVKLKTHNVGGITEKDFALAKKIDEVIGWMPGEDSVLDGNPKREKWVS